MDVAELLERVQAYGLEDGEARFYYHLSRLGASRAAAVAQAAGSKRTDAYRLLDHLVEKGFAHKSLERPTRYLPVPLEEALTAALAARRKGTETLEREARELATLWPRAAIPASGVRQRFAVYQGRAQVDGMLARLVASATEDIVMAASADGLTRLDAGALARALAQRADAGVLVRVLARPASHEALPLAGLPGVQVRYASLPTLYQALIVDAREVALFVSAGRGISGTDETVLVITASDVVLAQKALFDQAWSVALAPGDLGPGARREVQVLRGRWVRAARLVAMLEGARREVLVQAPISELAAWPRHGVLPVLASLAARGVRVRLRMERDEIEIDGAEVEPFPPGGGLVALVDGNQILLGLDQSGPDIPATDEWAVWSTHPGLASAFAALQAPDGDVAFAPPQLAPALQNGVPSDDAALVSVTPPRSVGDVRPASTEHA